MQVEAERMVYALIAGTLNASQFAAYLAGSNAGYAAAYQAGVVPNASRVRALALSSSAMSTVVAAGDAALSPLASSREGRAAVLGQNAGAQAVYGSSVAAGKFAAAAAGLLPTSYADAAAIAADGPSVSAVFGSGEASDIISNSPAAAQAFTASAVVRTYLSGNMALYAQLQNAASTGALWAAMNIVYKLGGAGLAAYGPVLSFAGGNYGSPQYPGVASNGTTAVAAVNCAGSVLFVYTTDLVSWSPCSMPAGFSGSASDFASLGCNGGVFYAAVGPTIYSSTDGKNWSSVYTASFSPLVGLCYGVLNGAPTYAFLGPAANLGTSNGTFAVYFISGGALSDFSVNAFGATDCVIWGGQFLMAYVSTANYGAIGSWSSASTSFVAGKSVVTGGSTGSRYNFVSRSCDSTGEPAALYFTGTTNGFIASNFSVSAGTGGNPINAGNAIVGSAGTVAGIYGSAWAETTDSAWSRSLPAPFSSALPIGGFGAQLLGKAVMFDASKMAYAYTADLTGFTNWAWCAAGVPCSAGFSARFASNGSIAVSVTNTTPSTTTDGSTWTAAAPLSFSPQDIGVFKNSAGADVFCAIAGANVYSSPDGDTWSALATTASGDTYGYGRAMMNGIAVFVGASYIVAVSASGVTQVPRPFSSSFSSICGGNGVFVALSTGGQVSTSPSGAAWTTLPASCPLGVNPQIAYNGAVYSVVSSSTLFCASSADLSSWETKTSPVYFAAVKSELGLFFGFKNNQPVYVSSDGLSYSPMNVSLTLPSEMSTNIRSFSINGRAVFGIYSGVSIFGG